MNAGGLLHDGDSAVHRLPPEAKVAAAIGFAIAVVATPAGSWTAFATDAVVVVVCAHLAGLSARFVLRRLRVELPFVAFALLLPVVGDATAADAATLITRSTLALGAAVVLAGTTPVPELLVGLERLRVPKVLVAIAGFMARYLDVVIGEAQRMRTARLCRAADPRWLWQAGAVASTTGSLFVRAYERGERVHQAMLARGYTGAMPPLHHHARGAAPPAAVAAAPVALAAAAAALVALT